MKEFYDESSLPSKISKAEDKHEKYGYPSKANEIKDLKESYKMDEEREEKRAEEREKVLSVNQENLDEESSSRIAKAISIMTAAKVKEKPKLVKANELNAEISGVPTDDLRNKLGSKKKEGKGSILNRIVKKGDNERQDGE